MDINKICPGCMQEIENRDSVEKCPNCGYDLKHMAAASHQMQPFTILAGKYLVGKVIGEGGFGISYLGFDLNLEIVVAIKEFYPNGFVTRESNVTTMVSMYAGKNEADVNKWRDGFINEARNLAKFSNLNGIVEVRDFFNENGTAYIVMEYIDGITLKEYLKQNGGKLPVDKTFQMMEPVIRSLSKVHDAGLIHRDISPDNIMITKYGGMKLLDFGAAREFAGNAEKSLSIMLKPGYAPEEQYRSRGKQGPWSDVYALAATIYKCITGITPVESMERMREDSLKMPKELGVNISDLQNEAIKMGMAVYAENRFQNMDAFYKALYSGNDGAIPVPAPPVPEPAGQNVPDREKSGVKFPEGNLNDTNKKVIIAGAAAVCCILVILVVIAVIPKGTKKGTADNFDKKAVSKVSDDNNNNDNNDNNNVGTTQDEPSDAESLDSMMAGGNYESAVNFIAESGLNEPEILQKAVDELYSQCLNETTALAQNGNFDTAFQIVEERKQYFQDVADRTGYLEDKHEYDLTQQTYNISQIYIESMSWKAQECANNEDEAGMLDALQKMAEYASESDIDRKREQLYTDMILVHMDNMEKTGSTYPDRMAYISQNLSKSGNNCLLIELWYFFQDVYYKQIGVQKMQVTQIRRLGSGYIIPDSDSRELTYNDVFDLSEYETYFALFEIYARHGRQFSDSSVNRHFQQFGWYSGNVDRNDFDEGVLSDAERKNINLLIGVLGL